MTLPQPIPDNPTRWDGWKFYNSENPYERLCLSFDGNPSNDQVEDHCRQLLVWWQKKLPLKNQPSNPLSQMLRAGLDDAPKYLAEARTILLNSELRSRIDARLRSQLKEAAIAEFSKYLAFALAKGIVTEEDERNLHQVGGNSGLLSDEMNALIEVEMLKRGAKRQAVLEPVFTQAQAAPFERANPNATAPPRLAVAPASAGPAEEFARMLRLTGLDEDELTDDQRDALCNMGENLGLTGGQAEDLIDAYLEEVSGLPVTPVVVSRVAAPAKNAVPTPSPARKVVPSAARRDIASSPLARAEERAKNPNFKTALGLEMLYVTSGTFMMGNLTPGAPPNEQPVTKTSLSGFFMSRFPVTNEQFEEFDPTHRTKRAPTADGNHPVIYVSSLEAIKFCDWMSAREGRRFRLATEAEWEFAARGNEWRPYPWGEKLNRGDLANFADCNTSFPWRDAEIDDGYAETAPVGTYPRGASPFGLEDMAGNVWEWCLDFFEPYKGKERTNPRGSPHGVRRVYRGGSWKSRATSLRTTARNFNVPDYSSNDVGFRIVCETAT